MENTEFEKTNIKHCLCYHFDDKTKFEEFEFDNIILDEKLFENILIYEIS